MPVYQPSITKEEVKKLPLLEFKGELFLVDKLADVAKAIAVLEKEVILGFDTETRPSFKKGEHYHVALMQLSTATKCFLFRICKIGLPNELIDILANKKIAKIGAAVHDDIKQLQAKKHFLAQNFIDLQKFVKPYGIVDISVAKLTAIVLQAHISKKQQVTNWEVPTLTDAQQVYAATDAWACRQIYCKLMEG